MGWRSSVEGYEVLGGSTLGDLEDLGLRAVDNLGHVLALGAGVAVLDDASTGVDQTTQHGLLGHDLGIEGGVGGCGHCLGQRHQVGSTTDTAELTSTVELGGDRHRVGGLATAVEVQDHVVDGLVGGPVEVTRTQYLEDVSDGVLAQQHAAEHRLLGSHVLRWLASELLVGLGLGRARVVRP